MCILIFNTGWYLCLCVCAAASRRSIRRISELVNDKQAFLVNFSMGFYGYSYMPDSKYRTLLQIANQSSFPTANCYGSEFPPHLKCTEPNEKSTWFLHTVDGRIPAPVDIFIYTDYPIIYEVFYTYIPGGAGFLPSTVSFGYIAGFLHTSHIATLLNPDEFHIREVLRYIQGAILKPEKVNIIMFNHNHLENWDLTYRFFP